MFLACAKRHYLVLALHAIHRASIDVTNSALSGRAYFRKQTLVKSAPELAFMHWHTYVADVNLHRE